MDIFISWSGPQSRGVAEALKQYLPMIVNAFNPWLSCADIDKGARWISELSSAFATAKAGIICLTPNNFTAPYILFESGALSKTVGKPYVCTLLIGMEPSDVTGPLAQFQATKPTDVELLQLVKSLNKALGDSAVNEAQLEATFNLCWPKLKEALENLPADGPTVRPKRTDRELLEELVDTMRSTSAQTADRIAILKSELNVAVELLAEQIGKVEGAVAVLQMKNLQQPTLPLSDSQPTNSPGTPLSANPFAEVARSIAALKRAPFGLEPEFMAQVSKAVEQQKAGTIATGLDPKAIAEVAKVMDQQKVGTTVARELIRNHKTGLKLKKN
jgi:hypothetical protein